MKAEQETEHYKTENLDGFASGIFRCLPNEAKRRHGNTSTRCEPFYEILPVEGNGNDIGANLSDFRLKQKLVSSYVRRLLYAKLICL